MTIKTMCECWIFSKVEGISSRRGKQCKRWQQPLRNRWTLLNLHPRAQHNAKIWWHLLTSFAPHGTLVKTLESFFLNRATRQDLEISISMTVNAPNEVEGAHNVTGRTIDRRHFTQEHNMTAEFDVTSRPALRFMGHWTRCQCSRTLFLNGVTRRDL